VHDLAHHAAFQSAVVARIDHQARCEHRPIAAPLDAPGDLGIFVADQAQVEAAHVAEGRAADEQVRAGGRRNAQPGKEALGAGEPAMVGDEAVAGFLRAIDRAQARVARIQPSQIAKVGEREDHVGVGEEQPRGVGRFRADLTRGDNVARLLNEGGVARPDVAHKLGRLVVAGVYYDELRVFGQRRQKGADVVALVARR